MLTLVVLTTLSLCIVANNPEARPSLSTAVSVALVVVVFMLMVLDISSTLLPCVNRAPMSGSGVVSDVGACFQAV